MKDLRVSKIVKEIKFKGVWGDLKAKNCFQKWSFTGYMRLTLVFVWDGQLASYISVGMAQWEGGLIYVFQGFVANISGIWVLEGGGGLAAGLSFCGVFILSSYFLISWDPEILSVKLFGKLWSNTYIPCL